MFAQVVALVKDHPKAVKGVGVAVGAVAWGLLVYMFIRDGEAALESVGDGLEAVGEAAADIAS